MVELSADHCRSIFEAVITPIWKSLGLEDDNSIVSDNLDACSDLVEILYQLVAIQSKEQWLRFSHSPSSMSNSRSSSQANGKDVFLNLGCCWLMSMSRVPCRLSTNPCR